MNINSQNQNNRIKFTAKDKSNQTENTDNPFDQIKPGMSISQIKSFTNKDNIPNKNIFQINTDNGNSLFNANNTKTEQITNQPSQNQQIIIKGKEIPGIKTTIKKTKYIIDGKEISEEEMKKHNDIFTKKIITNPKITTTTKTTTTTTIIKDGKKTITKTENITTKNESNENDNDNNDNNEYIVKEITSVNNTDNNNNELNKDLTHKRLFDNILIDNNNCQIDNNLDADNLFKDNYKGEYQINDDDNINEDNINEDNINEDNINEDNINEYENNNNIFGALNNININNEIRQNNQRTDSINFGAPNKIQYTPISSVYTFGLKNNNNNDNQNMNKNDSNLSNSVDKSSEQDNVIIGDINDNTQNKNIITNNTNIKFGYIEKKKRE